jgi:hypothetical protein
VTTNSGSTVQLSVSASVQQNPYGSQLAQGYLWYKNATNLVFAQSIVGTNNTTGLTIGGAADTDSGTYTAVVTNFWGRTTSAPAIVSVTSPPKITSQPVSKSALVGQNVTLSAIASGTAPLTLQWNKNNSPLSDGGVYSGTGTTALSLTSVSLSDNGSYTLSVSNGSGSTNSNPALLTVAAPPQVTLDPSSSTISGTTLPGVTYVVQSTTDLTAPIQWTSLQTNVTDNSGAISYTNTPSGTLQFLRVLFP